MFQKTGNPYVFKFLQTGITGPGIPCVYLPELPSEDKILFKKEQKFIRPEMPEHLKKEVKKWRLKLDESSNHYDPDYVSPYAFEIQHWEDTEWERSTDGVWFWNNGTPTYITGFYYWYLTAWQTYFGYPIFRVSDVEITYWIQYWEEDPDCYGGLLNTIRRYGKSSLMGGWATYRTTRNYNHYCGMQGEKDDKIAKFYTQMILQPFKKLPYYYKPLFDTNTQQKSEIRFERSAVRGKKAATQDLDEDNESLESIIEYRPSGESEYDGYILNSYVSEEPGKLLNANIYERWKIVKPCLRKGRAIRGKSFQGTTVEFMDVTNKGGKAYKKLFYDSDFDDRGPDGRTKTGLYAAFLPGDCAYEDFLDDWGFPMREAAKNSILTERESSKNNPKDHSDLIRKYPLYIKEIFYINTDKCVFNATILQDRLSIINMSKEPLTSKFDVFWENGKRFTKVKWRHNPVNGFAQACWLPDKEDEMNLTSKKIIGGVEKFFPANTAKFGAGVDPVDHRLIIEGKSSGDDEVVNTRRSRPVMFIKRKYDSSIDGVYDQALLEKRRDEKYPYKTNRNVVMMDTRTSDPFVYYERALMLAWLFGCEVQVEDQKPGLKNYFYLNNCEGFLQGTYVPESNTKRINPYSEGTPASTLMINEYTEAKAWSIEYFGHCICFREQIEDDLVFNPRKTTEHDYSVADGWTDLACKMAPKNKPKPKAKIESFLPMVDQFGNPMN